MARRFVPSSRTTPEAGRAYIEMAWLEAGEVREIGAYGEVTLCCERHCDYSSISPAPITAAEPAGGLCLAHFSGAGHPIRLEGRRRGSRIIALCADAATFGRYAVEARGRVTPGGELPSFERRPDVVLLQHLVRAAVAPPDGFRSSMVAVVAALIAATGRTDREETGRRMSPSRLRRVHELIAADPPGLSLKAMAEEAGLGVYHFARCFKTMTGVAPWHFVLNQRAWRAIERLALDDGRPIGEVARETKFHDARHLSRVVRQLFDCPVTRLRKQLIDANARGGSKLNGYGSLISFP